jgi:5-enolpyruvylshikimate-3-phosphate synthase
VLPDKEKAVKDRDAKKKALQAAEEDLAAITEAQGLLHKNADPSEARWVDLFRGEEIANYKLVDMSKVQMLLFTVAVIAAYAAAISSMLRDVEALRTATSLSFPDFAPSLNALLGISHGTYLSVKTIDHG